jgi:Fe-S cluster biogenesis protein NfuA
MAGIIPYPAKLRKTMFIQTESTPNPASMKFLPDQVIMTDGSADFANAAAALASPLAQRLFQIQGVERVFLGHDFITVSKTDGFEWVTLKPQILAAIMEHLLTGQTIMNGGTIAAINPADVDEISSQIMELLETRVRPAVAMDGGDIVFDRRGACSGCPSSTATLKSGIENMLKHYVPEVTEVRAVAA